MSEMSAQASVERWIFKIGSAGAISGALLAGIGNFLHPATPIGDPEGIAQVIAESAIWVPVHLVIVIGLILMLGGFIAISHSIRDGLAGALARFGFVAAIAGTTVGLILVTIDGLASKWLAEAWALAPPEEQAAALRLALASQTIDFALASLFNILYAGVTFTFYGLAVALSHAYPRWLGWVAVVAAVGSIAAGLIQAYLGEPAPITRILTIIMPTILTLWLLVMGIFLARKAGGTA